MFQYLLTGGAVSAMGVKKILRRVTGDFAKPLSKPRNNP